MVVTAFAYRNLHEEVVEPLMTEHHENDVESMGYIVRFGRVYDLSGRQFAASEAEALDLLGVARYKKRPAMIEMTESLPPIVEGEKVINLEGLYFVGSTYVRVVEE